MMVGILVGEEVELWSRGGWTEQAVSATRHANSVVGLCELVSEVYERGGSPTFEYIGKQSLVKVRYKETDLVLVAIRDRETGKWWEYSQLQEVCERWQVQLVERFQELEGEGIRDVNRIVAKWEGLEGVVARTAEGQVYKVKTDWWFRVGRKQKRRWYSSEAKLQAKRREQKRRHHLEREDQRLVIVGWDSKRHPSLLLQVLEKAMKVEAFYKRADGRQMTVIVSFSSRVAAEAVIGRRVVAGRRVKLERAYSSRSTPNQERRLKTWWRSGVVGR